MKTEKYESPEVLDNFVVSEPVETGCCLRSCGGKPCHFETDKLVSKEVKEKFEQVNINND